jgi:PD-(D/E)XK nuclease superfamily
MAADLLRVSVKQLEMAFSCPRKWAYHYLEGVPQLEGEALAVGNALHAQMKALLTGTKPAHGPETFIGKMARELMQYAEGRSVRAVSEIVKQVPLPRYGVRVDLRCDFMDRPKFKDWKTTGAPSRTAKLQNGRLWALADLTNDFQFNIYAFLLMEDHWKGTTEVEGEWCYVSKKFQSGQTPKTWTVKKVITYAEALAWWETYCVPVIALIKELKALWAEKQLDRARMVPHNPASCEWTGHFCDAAGHCAMVSSPVTDYKGLHLPVLKG